VDALAQRLDLHRNTVRAHLAVLEDAGLARSEREERDRPGRPRLVYRAGAAVLEPAAAGYRFLAQMLAGHVAVTSAEPAQESLALGRAWGRHLVEAPAPSQPLGPSDAVREVVALLDEIGFDPRLDTSVAAPRVLLRHCPFLEVAEAHQEVVCSIHLGLMRGALGELTHEVEVEQLVPFVEPGLCVSHLTPWQ
jgi:predicted ArsR family transcriptional regulator